MNMLLGCATVYYTVHLGIFASGRLQTYKLGVVAKSNKSVPEIICLTLQHIHGNRLSFSLPIWKMVGDIL